MADNFDRWMATASQAPEISEARLAQVIHGVMAKIGGEATPALPMFASRSFITRLGLSMAMAMMLGVLAAPLMLEGAPPHGCLRALVSTVYDTSEVY
jgi:hypothetical protein